MEKGRAAKAWVIVAALGLLSGAALAAETKTFSESEKAAIEAVVRDYLKENPEVVLDAIKALEAKERAKRAEAAKQTILAEQDALKNDPSSYVAGNPKGDVTVVEFFDYNCGYCRKVAPAIQSLLADDKKLRVIFKDWPIKGADSLAVAQVSLAAARQPQFLAFHFSLLRAEGHIDQAAALEAAKKAGLDMNRLQRDMKAIDTMEIVKRNDELAQKIGLDGTPAFIIGTTLVPGAVSEDRMKKLIAEVRKTCKQASC